MKSSLKLFFSRKNNLFQISKDSLQNTSQIFKKLPKMELFQISFLLTLSTLVLFLLITFLFGYRPLYKSYDFPYIQFLTLLMLTMALFLEIIFFLGTTFYHHFAIIELGVVSVFSCMEAIFYFFIFKRTLTLEALSLCFSDTQIGKAKNNIDNGGLETKPNSQQELEGEEDYSLTLRKEIQETGFSEINSREFQKKCVYYMFLRIKKFSHAKCLRCILGVRNCETKKEVTATLKKYDRAVTAFCILLPSIFLILEFLKHFHIEMKEIIFPLNILKCMCMVNFNYEMTMLLSNLKFFLKKTHLLGKFNCLRAMILFFLCQNVLMTFFGARTQMGLSLNFVLLSMENLILIYFWIKYYGVKGSEGGRFKGIETIYTGKFEERDDKEANLLVENVNDEKIYII